jgi:hypothetical protein
MATRPSRPTDYSFEVAPALSLKKILDPFVEAKGKKWAG